MTEVTDYERGWCRGKTYVFKLSQNRSSLFIFYQHIINWQMVNCLLRVRTRCVTDDHRTGYLQMLTPTDFQLCWLGITPLHYPRFGPAWAGWWCHRVTSGRPKTRPTLLLLSLQDLSTRIQNFHATPLVLLRMTVHFRNPFINSPVTGDSGW